MSTRKQPVQQPPPVQRLRVQYAKRGRARFTSHRDFSRAFERALFRADIPMAYSSGFNPHMRISYANASPTGAATEAEYLEIGLALVCDPAAVRTALDEALPPGLDVLAVTEATPVSLADLLQASHWRIERIPAERDRLAEAVALFLAAPSVEVQRMTKTGLRTFDTREPVISLAVVGDDGLDLVIRHGTPLVRPDDVVTGLRSLVPDLDDGPALITRLAQGPYVEGAIQDPFAV